MDLAFAADLLNRLGPLGPFAIFGLLCWKIYLDSRRNKNGNHYGESLDRVADNVSQLKSAVDQIHALLLMVLRDRAIVELAAHRRDDTSTAIV
jgi:hypothetical protein